METVPGLDVVPSTLQASNGTLWVAWESLRANQYNIFAKKYNSGVWSADFNITTPTPATANIQPSLKQLINGTIVFFWSGNSTGTNQIYYKTLNGNSWGAPRTLTSGSFNDYRADADVAPNGTLWVFWYRQTTSGSCTSGFCRQVYYKTLTGNIWSADTQLTTDNTWNIEPDVVVTKDGKVMVAFSKWIASGGGDWNVYYRKYDGTSWSGDVSVVTGSTYDTTPNLAQDRNGTVWLFWAREIRLSSTVFQDKLFYKFSPNAGTTWGIETQLTFGGTVTNTIDDNEPDAVQAQDKSLWIFYSSDATGNGADFDIYYIKTNAITPIHDVAAAGFQYPNYQYRGGLPSIGQSAIVKLNVTVANIGDFTETPQVSLTVSNTTSYNLGTKTVTVAAGATAIVTFNWNTTGVPYGLYNLSASIAPVPGENSLNTPDNNRAKSSTVRIGPWTDIDQDGKITLIDAGVVFIGFGSRPGNAHWNPLADINNNGQIDIVDAGIVASSYGLVT